MVEQTCFEAVDADVPEIGDRQALLRVRYLGIDPAIRGWLDDVPGYLPPVGIGEVVRSNGVGTIVATNDPETFPLGAPAMALTGWQEYRVVTRGESPPVTVLPEGTPMLDVLDVFGHIGVTAYFGMLEVGDPKPGDTVVVSAAASGVGSIAGQIARIRGARVIGIAGTDAKCRWVVEECGFDACVNYRTDDVAARLKELCPDGVDVFFDNVGGDHLEAALDVMNPGGRAALCGAISTYNAAQRSPGPDNMANVITRGLSLRGFTIGGYLHRAEEFNRLVAGWFAQGAIAYDETVVDGIENAVDAFLSMMRGGNVGKMLVRTRVD